MTPIESLVLNSKRVEALTGCVATAMAQVMNYHRWPKSACEKIPAYKYPYNDDTLSLDELPQRTFNWDLMKTDMTMAHLMRCAVSRF